MMVSKVMKLYPKIIIKFILMKACSSSGKAPIESKSNACLSKTLIPMEFMFVSKVVLQNLKDLPSTISGLRRKRLVTKLSMIEAIISLKTRFFLNLWIVTDPFSSSHSCIGYGSKQHPVTWISTSIPENFE